MKWLRKFSVLGLALLLTVGVSCTSSDSALTEAPVAEPTEQPSQFLGSIDDLAGGLTGTLGGVTDAAGGLTGAVAGTLGKVTDLLTCTPQPYAVTTQAIGRNGGTIQVGTHRLEIPKNALFRKVIITAEQIPGSTNSVRFSPDNLEFERPATLTMSYENCAVVLLRKHIVYTDEDLNVLQVLRSLDLFKKKTVIAPIDHFSRYAVAF
jgi:hypothetical protein